MSGAVPSPWNLKALGHEPAAAVQVPREGVVAGEEPGARGSGSPAPWPLSGPAAALLALPALLWAGTRVRPAQAESPLLVPRVSSLSSCEPGLYTRAVLCDLQLKTPRGWDLVQGPGLLRWSRLGQGTVSGPRWLLL